MQSEKQEIERVARIADIEGIVSKEYTPKIVTKREAKTLFQNFVPVQKSFVIDYFELENIRKKPRNFGKEADGVRKTTLNISFSGGIAGRLRGFLSIRRANIISDIRTIFENAQYGYSTNYVITEVRRDGSVHKEHSNIEAYHHFINKVRVDGKEYYIRFTVEELKNTKKGQVHSAQISEVEIINKISREDSRSLPGPDLGGTAQPAYDVNLADFINSVKF